MTHFDSYRNTTCTRNFFMKFCCCSLLLRLLCTITNCTQMMCSLAILNVTWPIKKPKCKKINMKICCVCVEFFFCLPFGCAVFALFCSCACIVNIHWEIICRNANNRWVWHGRRLYFMGRSWKCFALFSFNTIEFLPLFLLHASVGRCL